MAVALGALEDFFKIPSTFKPSYGPEGRGGADVTSEALKAEFTPIAKQLADNEQAIIKELNDIQGKPTDLGGYYEPDEALINQVMRPSETFNTILR